MKLKKYVNYVIYSVLILCTVTSLCGCGKQSKVDNQERYEGYLWNGGDRTKHLAKFQPELDEIPRDYLKYINLDPEEYNIDTLEQWSNNNFSAQAAYHSYVYKKDGDPDAGFYIWVLDDGRTIDTRFVEDLSPVVQDYFAQKLSKNYPDVRVFTSVFFHNMPSREWSEADGIETLLNSDDDYRIYMYLVYGPDANISESDVEAIKNELSNLNDVEVWFHRVDNPDNIEMTELYKMDEEYHFIEQK